jgi:hypothetical protein
MALRLPSPRAVSSPEELMDPSKAFEHDQSTPVLSVCVLPSLKCPVTVNCCERSRPSMVTGLGEIVIETKVAELTVNARLPLTPCKLAVADMSPTRIPLTNPVPLISAIDALLEAQETLADKFCVDPSL